jgi:hypothetical protein
MKQNPTPGVHNLCQYIIAVPRWLKTKAKAETIERLHVRQETLN